MGHGSLKHLKALGRNLRTKRGRSRDVSTRLRKTDDQPARHSIGADRHDYGDCRCGLFEDACPRATRHDYIWLEMDQFSGEGGKPIELALRPAIFDKDVTALNVT